MSSGSYGNGQSLKNCSQSGIDAKKRDNLKKIEHSQAVKLSERQRAQRLAIGH